MNDEPRPSPRRHDGFYLAAALVVVVTALLLHVTPDRAGITVFGWRVPELCAIKRVGGTCPGCGMTRSFVRAARGDLGAFRFHPAGPLLFAFIAAQIPYRGARILARRRREARGEPEPEERPLGWIAILCMGALGAALLLTWGGRVGGWLT